LGIEIPQALGLDLVLQLCHFVRGFVRVVRGELVIAIKDRFLRSDALHHVLAHGLLRVELWLLLEVAHTRTSAAQASPANSVSMPAMMRSSVDLPEPLTPSTPILASGQKEWLMSPTIFRCPGRQFARPSM